MQVTQEKRAGSRVGLTIVVEAEQVKKSYEKTLRYLTQNVQIQGFRKGKAPRGLVVRQVGKERVTATAMDDLLNDAIKQALEESDIQPITQFELETSVQELVSAFNPETDLTFTGTVEVYPNVQVGQYKDLAITVERADPTPNQFEETVDRWRNQRATLIPVEDRAAQLGDVVVVDFAGFDDEGNELEDVSGTDFRLDLEEANFIPGFVAGIVGMQLEETKDIQAQFPDDYFNEELAGISTTFKVTLHEVKEKELPTLDDSFVQEISDLQTVEELQEHLARRFEREAYIQSQNNLEEVLLGAILETTEVDLPPSMVTQEIRHLISRSLSALKEQGLPANDIQQFLSQLPEDSLKSLEERFHPEAIDRLRRTLLLGEIVKREQIAVGQTELEVGVSEVLRGYEGDRRQLNMKRLQEVVHDELITAKVMSWLKEQATPTWVDEAGNPVDPPQDPDTMPDSELVPEAEFTDTPELAGSESGVVDVDAATVVDGEPTESTEPGSTVVAETVESKAVGVDSDETVD